MQLRINVNGFELVTKESLKWPGRKLRFHLEWWVEREDGTRAYWMVTKGCLARLNDQGEVIWTPPQAGRPGYNYAVIDISDSIYQEVRDAITGSKWFAKLKEFPLEPRMDKVVDKVAKPIAEFSDDVEAQFWKEENGF